MLHPDLGQAQSLHRSPEARLAEAVGLAAAIDLEVVGQDLVRVKRARPSTLIGPGVIERLHAIVEIEEIGLVVVDCALTPVQQRNLERELGCKVIDRTGLILEIFGERARTREGTLQVELAALEYQRTRLVRSWTHLERQRGGLGFIGGPGESQLEIDRRLITERIVRLKRELEEVRRTRGLHRAARERVPYPVIALVGYTNAGKSTLFNRLTGASAMAADMLFATLDPTLRRVRLPSGSDVMLSDTVGFISDLPTELVAAFRATLEEVTEAAIVLHVRDVAQADTEAERADVEEILADLGIEHGGERPIVEVLNKVDLLDPEARAALAAGLSEGEQVMVSAATGEGTGRLLDLVDRLVTARRVLVRLEVPPAEGERLAWLYERGEVVEREDGPDALVLTVRLEPADLERYRRRFGAPCTVLEAPVAPAAG